MNPVIQYPGYTVEISDHLMHPFKVLAMVLASDDFQDPMDIYGHPRGEEIIATCMDCILAAIGKQFAHDSCIGDAVNKWRSLSEHKRIKHVITAAAEAGPFDVGYLLETGQNPKLN